MIAGYLKRLFCMKRYFMIHYTYNSGESVRLGFSFINTDFGVYPSNAHINEFFKEKCGYYDFIIFSIKEFSKQDYYDFIK